MLFLPRPLPVIKPYMPTTDLRRWTATVWRQSLLTAAAWALFGLAWILVSDALVDAVSQDHDWLRAAQRWKGLAFVALSTLLLVGLVRAGQRRLLATVQRGEQLARQALERQEAQFRQLHQSLGEVLWLASPDGRTLHYISPGFERLYGRPAADIERDPALWAQCVHRADMAIVEDSIARLREQGVAECEYRIVRPDGSVCWIEDRKKLIRDETGRVVLMGGIAEDVSMRRERDEAREALNGRLERLVEERTAALACANAELDTFTRTAAHDLKSPLNAISGFAHLLRRRYEPAFDAAGRQMVERIEQLARDMAGLVDDLLAMARVGNVAMHKQRLDIVPMVREIVADLQQSAPQRACRLDLPPTLELDCDPGLMRSLLLNLLGNAWKFSARVPVTQITLALQPDAASGQRTVSLSDNGAGFDRNAAGALFQPFRRFHREADFPGTGLGLATCARILQRHGGSIDVDSAPGAGTTVRFTLPG